MREIVLGNTVVIGIGAEYRRQETRPGPAVLAGGKLEVRTMTLTEARAAADFRVWQPAYLPSTGMELAGVQVLLDAESRSHRVNSVVSKYRETPFRWIAIEQARMPGQGCGRIGVPFEIREGSISGKRAAFFAHDVEATGWPDGRVSIAHCLWEHDGFLMELQGPVLSTEDMTRIGASLVA